MSLRPSLHSEFQASHDCEVRPCDNNKQRKTGMWALCAKLPVFPSWDLRVAAPSPHGPSSLGTFAHTCYSHSRATQAPILKHNKFMVWAAPRTWVTGRDGAGPWGLSQNKEHWHRTPVLGQGWILRGQGHETLVFSLPSDHWASEDPAHNVY